MTRLKLKPPKKRKSFYDLPPELRNVIYELVFEDLPAVHTPPPRKPKKRGRRATIQTKTEAQNPGLLLVASKQIYQEAAPMFYAKSTFEFSDVPNLLSFLRKIGINNRKFLCHIIVEGNIQFPQFTGSIPHGTFAEEAVKGRLMALGRRLRDAGLALSTGAVTLRGKCWFPEADLLVACFWEDGNGGMVETFV